MKSKALEIVTICGFFLVPENAENMTVITVHFSIVWEFLKIPETMLTACLILRSV